MARAKPDWGENLGITILGVGFIVVWFWLPRYGGILYGRYGEVIFGILSGGIGWAKGRNPVAWFAVGLWSVFIGVIVALSVPRLASRLCQFCREAVDEHASVCPHCQREILALAPTAHP